MIIKILGMGCPKCKKLEEHVRKAVSELEIDAQIIKVTQMEEIMALGVMNTPGLVIDDKVVMTGRVPSAKLIKTLLK